MIETQCCIVGGGPAGMMLGFLLARAGVKVVVLEKHGDFLRDFRGDTVHPSTLTVMHELGLLDEFLKLPHHRISQFTGYFGDTPVKIADLSHLPVPAPFIAMMPQWDFLDFLASHGKAFAGFTLLMHAEAQGVIEESGRVVGVRAVVDGRPEEIRAALVVGADGRRSIIRNALGLKVQDIGAPMDVLWFRISHKAGDPNEVFGRFDAGRILVMLDRGDYWQCAFVIAKGAAERVRAEGIDKVRATVAALAPMIADRVGELRTIDDLKLLTVGVDRLEQWWRPGALCIGDAAHTMSPIGGIGINIAIQDAVASANILAPGLRPRRRPGAAPVPGARHAGRSGLPAESDHRAVTGSGWRPDGGAVSRAADATLPCLASSARATDGAGCAARARAYQGRQPVDHALFDRGRRLGLANRKRQ
jgi:2-polyprenyl-6-methoxyphenol hydroxylase-like FAD-dependent oxidoreductase